MTPPVIYRIQLGASGDRRLAQTEELVGGAEMSAGTASPDLTLVTPGIAAPVGCVLLA